MVEIMEALLFDIQRFSIHDGPGIRTSVFCKGCTLRCAWCHNPEGLHHFIETQYYDSECIHCNQCKGVVSRENAILCPSGAQKICGFKMSTDELLHIVMRDQAFYGNDGGVTFSGGECLLQSDFVCEACKKAKMNDIRTCIDTSGYVPWSDIEKTIDVCDLYLYDIKVADPEKHLFYTGGKLETIIQNLTLLADKASEIWIRIPVIPGVNDTVDGMKSIRRLIPDKDVISTVTLIPYHKYGLAKYKTLGMNCDFKPECFPTLEQLNELKSVFTDSGFFVQ